MTGKRVAFALRALVAALVGFTASAAQAQTLNINNVSMAEGATGTQTFTFSVTLTAPAGGGGVTFDIATADGTAQDDNPASEDNDYVARSLTGQNIPSGSTGPYLFQVTVNGDGNAEPNETFFVNVTSIVGATAGDTQGLGTIQNDDIPTLTIDDVSRSEGNSGLTFFNFSVSLSTPDHGDISFDIATAPDTAVAGTDYVHKNLHVELPASVFSGFDTYLFQVTVNRDVAFEGNDTFFVNVTNVTGATVVDGQGLGTILNDDAAPSFSIDDISLVEGNSGTQLMSFTITKSGTTELTHGVNVATADSSATVADSDYVANSLSPMSFLPSDTSKTFNVPINGDTDGNSEGNEQFFVNLSSATNGATISDSQGRGVIRTDDPVSITALNTPVVENFDGLAQTPAATTPPGWTYVESGGSANAIYSAGTGSSATGDTYSFGVAGTNPITDRALGTLRDAGVESIFGAFYRNDTGATIQSLTVAYTGEQWRLGTAGRLDTLQLQYSFDATSLTTGTWLDVDSGIFVTPDTAGVGAKDGNAIGTRLQQAGQLGNLLSMAPGETVWIRFIDFDAGGADDGLAIDDFSIIADYVGTFLTVGALSVFEGHAGTSTLTFVVSVNNPAPEPGGVTFDIATQDFTATVADNDYEPLTLVGQNIPAGQTEKQYQITINGDITVEAVEQFYVHVTNVSNAIVVDGRGYGTIVDDDTLTRIANVQGNGATSPMVGNSATIRGIVTGVSANGFFVQEEDVDADADPNTSEGIFVFTASPPPAAAAFSAQVHVTGTVTEFVPGADPQQPPMTELTSPTMAQTLPPGQTLPTAITLTPTFPDPAGVFDQLERVEHMRVSAASITVSGPSGGTVVEPAATGTSNGVFHGVVTGVARPFREAGIQSPDTVPSGTIPPIPRWDFNPERLRIESAAINSQPVLTVKSGDIVSSVTGPLDYGSRGYAIYPDGTPGTPVVTPSTLSTTVTAAAANEVTVASFNLRRFFDRVDDPYSDAVLTVSAYANRLAKASIAVRNHLLSPDIIAVQEVETLAVLSDLANQIVNDGGPTYDSFLVEGNDTTTSLDIGFLVKTTPVTGGVARVSNVTVTQLGAAATWIDPGVNSAQLLHDRPPLQLEASINRAAGVTFPIVVIGTHLVDVSGIDSESPDGLTTGGDRVRQKRLAQSQHLAGLVQTRLTSTPGEHLVVAGDFNAFDVNDGYVDVVNTVAGTPPPDNETVVPGDGVDLVNPDLVNLVTTLSATERYSQVDAGNASSADHALVSAGLVTDTTARRIEHSRINADYPEIERNNDATALRISDRDPVVAYFAADMLELSDLVVTKSAPGSVTAGTNLTYTITVTNSGPDTATSLSLSDTLPVGTTGVSLTQDTGPAWSCATGGTISCSIASYLVGTTSTFTVVVTVAPSVAAGTVLANTASVSSSTSDPDTGNSSQTATTTVAASADLSINATDTPDPVTAGTNLTYTITVTNGGPSNAASASLSDTLPAGTTFVSLSSPAGWSCTTPAVGSTGSVSCANSSFAATTAVFTLVVTVDADAAASGATTLSNTATASSSTSDPNSANNSITTATTVTASADLSISNIDTPDPVTAGANLTYTITVTNNGPSSAQSVVVSDPTPANATFISNSGACTTAFPCLLGTLADGQSATITSTYSTNAAFIGVVTNTATVSSTTADPESANDSSIATTTVGASSDVAITNVDTPDPVTAGANLTYTITVTNNGPSVAASTSLSDTLPVNTTFVSLASPAGWSCTTPAPGGTGSVACTNPSLGVASAIFTLTVAVAPSTAGGTVLSNTATVSSSTSDPNGANNSSTATTIAKASQTITFGAIGPQTFGGAPFTVSATATSGLAVTAFSSQSLAICTVAGNQVTIMAAGDCIIAADQAGDANYNAAMQVTTTVAIATANQTITFAPLGTRTLGSGTFTVGATAGSGLTVSFSSLTTGVCTVTGSTVTLVALGTCTIAADQAGNANYNAAPQVPQSFTVAPPCGGLALPAMLAPGQVALPYNQTLTLTNGAGAITWALSGALPPGLAFSNGEFTGTPSVHGAFPITVTATDANSCEVSASYPMAIAAERRLVIGAASDVSTVRAFNIGSAIVQSEISPFGTFDGGVSVAQGDVDGNGIADIVVGAGPGAGPAVGLFDGASRAGRLLFFAFDPTYRGGVTVAAGDVTGDGVPDMIAAAGCAGAPHVRAFDGRTGALVRAYTIPLPVPTCRLNVAAGDVNGDGVADLVVGAGDLGASFVEVVDGVTGALLRELHPFGTVFSGGVSVAAGDVNGDGFADIVTGAGPGGTPHVRVFDGTTGLQIAGPLGSFHAYVPLFPGGVRVGAGDLNGDGRAEVITVPRSGGGPHVRVWDGANAIEIYGLYGFDPSFGGGLFVAGPTPSARMNVDIAARTIDTEVRIAGWALREIANDTTGTDAIHAWAYPVGGGAPVFVGEALTRVPRPDLAAAFGGEFLMSGFDFSGTLAAGTYDLVIYARNSRTQTFDQARVVRITVN